MSETNVAPAREAGPFKTLKSEPDVVPPPAAPAVPPRLPTKPLQKIERKTPRRFRGVPPPLTFDIAALPDSTMLTEPEVCAVLRRAPPSLQNWRRFSAHPLKWRYVGGRILYELGSVRELLKGDPQGRKPRTKK